jgi:hypothetical protein
MRDLGGEAGIRTLGRTLRPYNGLANRRLQPLGHLTPVCKYTARSHLFGARSSCAKETVFQAAGIANIGWKSPDFAMTDLRALGHPDGGSRTRGGLMPRVCAAAPDSPGTRIAEAFGGHSRLGRGCDEGVRGQNNVREKVKRIPICRVTVVLCCRRASPLRMSALPLRRMFLGPAPARLLQRSFAPRR